MEVETMEGKILHFASKTPGARISEISRRLGVPYTTARNRCWDLAVKGQLIIKMKRHQVLVYLPGETINTDRPSNTGQTGADQTPNTDPENNGAEGK
jgi:hypothetical protein